MQKAHCACTVQHGFLLLTNKNLYFTEETEKLVHKTNHNKNFVGVIQRPQQSELDIWIIS